MEKNENGYTGRGSSPSEGRLPSEGEVQLAMVYSPKQAWRLLYSSADALSHGTLFEELYKPLEGYEK